MGADCVFCRIVAGEIPSKIVHQDDEVTAFHDINPQAPVHILIVPNEHIADITRVTAEKEPLVGHMLHTAARIGAEQGLNTMKRGYRLVINYGANAGMQVPHLHLHLIGGRTMRWPPG
ncbi:MAG: histidine triad nucleotide-binding protein [Ardenticatenaceae bacterium]|nr:histidine triad nucleotide-binding protein [Ardenticatenaceae bacterium]HBY98761.1 histidine triad nucleotide-binding protein [Chloroflexota bacterium]